LSVLAPSLTIYAEEEKKIVAPLLGKLYVSPISSEEKTRMLYEVVSVAVDDKLLTDATSRNALYKIHVSLGKIVNNFGEQEAGIRRPSRSVSVALDVPQGDDDKTVMPEPHIKEEDEDSSDGTIIRRNEGESLVDELLSDEEAV
jgi:condensin complex subunit 3